jgi:hypothetical protein
MSVQKTGRFIRLRNYIRPSLTWPSVCSALKRMRSLVNIYYVVSAHDYLLSVASHDKRFNVQLRNSSDECALFRRHARWLHGPPSVCFRLALPRQQQHPPRVTTLVPGDGIVKTVCLAGNSVYKFGSLG